MRRYHPVTIVSRLITAAFLQFCEKAPEFFRSIHIEGKYPNP